MADPVSILSLVLQVTPPVIRYIAAVKTASAERQKLLAEVISTADVLSRVRDTVQSQQSSNHWVRAAINNDSIVSTLKEILKTINLLSDKLKPKSGLGKVKQSLKWPFANRDMVDMLNRLSRSKQDIVVHFQLQSTVVDSEIFQRLGKLILGQETNDSYHQKTQDKIDVITSDITRQKLQGMVDNLSAFDHRKKHNLVSQARTKGTADWLFETDWFNDWFTGPVNLLVLRGGPGVGKTVLMSAVINFVKSRLNSFDHAVSAFIYLDYTEKRQQKYDDVLRSITKQVLQSGLVHIQQLEKLADATDLGLDEYLGFLDHEKFLSIMMASTRQSYIGRFYLMVDAFDESESKETQNHLVRLIEDLQHLQFPVKVLVTARSQTPVCTDLSSAAFHELIPSNEDVKSYILFRTQNDRRLRDLLARDPSRAAVILDAVLGRVESMFLFARLYMDTLADSRCLADLDEHLETLPQGSDALTSTYNETFSAYAHRSDIEELRQAVAVEVDKNEPDFNDRRLIAAGELIALCAGLVIVDTNSEEVRLVHQTTQEYFDKERERLFPHAKKELVTVCIKFLSYSRFQWCKSPETIHEVRQQNAFLPYVVDNLGHHFREAGDQCKEQIVDFLLNKAKFNFVEQIRLHYTAANIPENFDLSNVLAVAAKWKLDPTVVQALLDRGCPVNYHAHESDLPLHQAGYTNNTTLLEMFLDAGADPAQVDKTGNCALHAVTIGGNADMAKRICREHPSVLNLTDSVGNTPLHTSISWRKPDVTAVLVEAGADPCVCNDKQPIWPMRLARRMGSIEEMRRIFPLHRGMFERHDTEGCNILHVLSTNTDMVSEVKEVLQACPQIIDEPNENFHSPLHVAVMWNCNDVVRLLLEHGADYSLLGGKGRNEELLCSAASRENVVNLKRLLEAGADPSNGALLKISYEEDVPLSCIAATHPPELMQVLLEDPRFNHAAVSTAGNCAMHRALFTGHWDTASMVLRHDLEHGKKLLGVRNKWGMTPLHDAVKFGALKVAQELINAGAELSTENIDGFTELDLANSHGRADISDLLRQHGAKTARELASERTRAKYTP